VALSARPLVLRLRAGVSLLQFQEIVDGAEEALDWACPELQQPRPSRDLMRAVIGHMLSQGYVRAPVFYVLEKAGPGPSPT
jgi:hypothetical protein